MIDGGSLRIAVPDGNNPNKEYRDNCGINGFGADASDHKQFITFEFWGFWIGIEQEYLPRRRIQAGGRRPLAFQLRTGSDGFCHKSVASTYTGPRRPAPQSGAWPSSQTPSRT